MAYSTTDFSDAQFTQVLRRLFPARLLRQAIRRTTRTPRRARCLPAWQLLGVFLAWFWMPDANLPFVVRWLLGAGSTPLPTDSAIYQARITLGWAPLRWLCRHALRPLADPPRDPTVFYCGLRLVAVDGTTFTVADTPANERTFGRAHNQHTARSGFPLTRVVALCELGTHALIAWVARAFRRSESSLARRLLAKLGRGVLLLADRNFHSFDVWFTRQCQGFELLLRVQKGPKLRAKTLLTDGSSLSTVAPRRGPKKAARSLPVRVIAYEWTDAQGKVQRSRLVTSLLDEVLHPARVLIELYHTRWEIEGVFKEIKTQLGARTTHLRASEPQRVLQELDALLLGHYAVRFLMLEAARKAGVSPLELSFMGTIRVLHTRLSSLLRRPRRAKTKRRTERHRTAWEELLEAVGKQRAARRRARSCPRVKKVTRGVWPTKRAHHREQPLPVFQTTPVTIP